MSKYYVIEGNDDVAFTTSEAAYQYDTDHNPEYHQTKEQSFERYLNVIQDLDFDELNQEQVLCIAYRWNDEN